jgi:NADH dehydrogenase/NADH:ubiquinone oxidoreductase subunit G
VQLFDDPFNQLLLLLLLLLLQVKTTVTGTLTLLRANHPEDCMSCDVNGKCEFQDLITRYNVSEL